MFTARYGPHDLLTPWKEPFLGVLQSIRHLLDRPQCFRLGRGSPVGSCTRGFQTPSQGAHNNLAERTLRAVALGRNNWGVLGSESGGKVAATLYSIVGTCKHLGIDPFAYLKDTLPALFALGEKPTAEQLLDWLPDRWLLARSRAAPAKAG